MHPTTNAHAPTTEIALFFGLCGECHQLHMLTAGQLFGGLRGVFSGLGSGLGKGSGGGPEEHAPEPFRGRDQEPRGLTHPCECTVCEADVVVYVRAHETRRIAVTFENANRAPQPLTLHLSEFTTQDGTAGFTGHLLDTARFSVVASPAPSPTPAPAQPVTDPAPPVAEPAQLAQGSLQLTLGPHAKRTILVLTTIPEHSHQHHCHEARCMVYYADLRAVGCGCRPVRIAVAVLPDDCNGHEVRCGCC
jgi:hypothetical protein